MTSIPITTDVPVTTEFINDATPRPRYSPTPEEVRQARLLRRMKHRVRGTMLQGKQLSQAKNTILRMSSTEHRGTWQLAGCQRARAKHRISARATYLAWGFMRNRPYSTIEANPKTAPHWGKVRDMLCEHLQLDKRAIWQRLAEWRGSKDEL